MSKIVKHNEFKKVIDALWEKSKEVFLYFWEACKYFEEDKASLNKDNVFVGKNTFNEVNLIGKNAFVESIGNIQGTAHKNNVYCGNREVSTHKNNPPQGKQYVSAIKIRILDAVNIGDTVSGVCVAEVEKITNRVDDIVRKTIVSNGTFIVEEDANYGKCIYVPVQKEYSNDTYFLIGQKGTKSDLREYHLNNPSQCINGLDIDSLPSEGSQLNHNNGSGWLIIHSLVSDEINVREELKSLNDKVNDANRGKVTSVNGQNPNTQGEVTVNAEHIGYNGNTSNIIATNVQDAINELKDDMALIDNAEIFIVSDKTELDNFLGSPNTLKHGDLIYIIDSTDVVDFTGKPVNGGNPVAMIFDNTLGTGNNLRVFSKFSSNVNVSADNVSYDDQGTNLGVNNVQGAIERLNTNKIDTTRIGNTDGKIPQVEAGDKLNVSIIPNIPISNVINLQTELDSKVRTVNNQAPTLNGDVTVNAGQILAVMGNQPPNNVQTILNNLHTNIENNSRRITTLANQRHALHIGEIITTFEDKGNSYILDGVEFIYLGRQNNTINSVNYRDLTTAFGLPTSTRAFDLPYIPDVGTIFDLGKTRNRKTYIVARYV